MTSQVAVMSLYGAAVASDTVVTLNRHGNQKVIPNSSKIVELGPGHKVLALNSGNVSLNDFPHDLHLHEWAKTLSGPLSTLTEYVRSYKAWAASERRLSTNESQLSLLETFVLKELQDISDHLTSAREWRIPASDQPATLRALDKVDRVTIKEITSWLKNQDDFPDLSRQRLSEQLKDAGIDLLKKTSQYFSHMEPRVAPSNLASISDALWLAIGKFFYRDSDSELGFIGMGTEQSFVGAVKLRCAGVFGGGLQSNESPFSIEPSGASGRIVYFAQKEGIEATISGIHPQMLREAEEVFEELLEKSLGHDLQEAMYYGDVFAERVREASQRNFIDPMFSTISAYSISELAAFADTLVGTQANATIFEDRQSTVGGLIEVASIDSRDGVVWHRRLPKSKLIG